MLTVSCFVVISALCLSLTSPSHAGILGRIIGLHVEVNQMNATLGRVRATLGRVRGALDEIIAEIECPRENFTRFESSCYHFSEPLTVHGNSWAFARAMCWTKGSDLVSIESTREWAFLRSNTERGWYWTSAHKHRGVFVWETTGDNLNYAGFSPWYHHDRPNGEPNEPAFKCAYLLGTNGALWDTNCSFSGLRYICETRL